MKNTISAIFGSTAVVAIILMMVACSTTSHLPEGETLYTGIGTVNYVDQGDAGKKGVNSESGVIVAIADAATDVVDAFTGKKGKGTATSPAAMTEKDRRRLLKEVAKTNKDALEPAQTEVEGVLDYAPNNAFFGSSYVRTPLPIGLWAYNAWGASQKGLGHWLYKRIGSEPVLISTANPETRAKVAGNVLRNYGFFRGRVDYDVVYKDSTKKKAKVNYYVHTDLPFRIDSVEYLGFSEVADSLIHATQQRSYLKKGTPFSATALTNEQNRIATLLRNRGYYFYQASAATFKADTVQKPYKVQLRMQRSATLPPIVMRQWHIGRTNLTILNAKGDTVDNAFQMPNGTYRFHGRKWPVKPEAVMRNVLHRPGSLYRYREQQISEQLLNELGIFAQSSLSYTPRDTTLAADTLDVLLTAVLDKRYSADIEVNVTEKNTDRIGPGLTLGLTKKNAFKAAELLTFKVFGSYEWKTRLEKDQSSSIFNSYEVGTQLSLDIPRMLLPFTKQRKLRFPATTSFSLSADWLNRSGYYNLFSFSAALTYSWQKTRTSRHTLTPISLTYNRLLRSTHSFDSIMQARPSLQVSMQDRLVPAIEYTYAYTQGRRHRNPLTWQFTIKEAGALTSGVWAIAGHDFSEKNKEILNNPFAQFIKVSTELHNNFKIDTDLRLVTRLMGGVVYAYGNSTIVPYSDQFYSGGANSIRAFAIRSIGPGRFVSRGSRYSYMDQTGEIKLEGNVELRFPVFGSLSGALFVDTGNIWLLRSDENRPGGTLKANHFLSDLALGTGAGLRYDLDFLVVRLDLGFALHDPAATHSGYFSTGRFSDRFALHLAIGYPF